MVTTGPRDAPRVRILLIATGVAALAGCGLLLGFEDEYTVRDAGEPLDGTVEAGDAGAQDGGEDVYSGGAVQPTTGGFVTVFRAPARAAVNDGGLILMLSDDGFELGSTTCNGQVCVTGGLVP
jgi:hypothetical protein